MKRTKERPVIDNGRLLPGPGVTAYDLDDHAVLFEPASLMTFVLNPTATSIWRELAGRRNLASFAAKLAADTGIPLAQATRDVELIVSAWFRHGLLEGNHDRPTATAPNGSDISVRLRSPAPRKSSLKTLASKATFRLLNFHFEIQAAEVDLIDEISELLAHARVVDGASHKPPTRLFVRNRDDRWLLLEEGAELAGSSSRDSLVPVVITYVLMLSYLRSPCFAAIHGAAVSIGNDCVLMPGNSGSGKSTLLAALVAAGADSCTDDMAVLTDPPVRLRPLATPIGLKQGSWPVLANTLPELQRLRIYMRDDGQSIKYLVPGAHGRGRITDAAKQVTNLVFPRYSPSAANTLVPIPRAAALHRLAGAGYDLPGQISQRWLRLLTDWLRPMPCYELEFDDIDAAVAEITALFA